MWKDDPVVVQMVEQARQFYKAVIPPNRWGHSPKGFHATWLCINCSKELCSLEQFEQTGSDDVMCGECFTNLRQLLCEMERHCDEKGYERMILLVVV